MPKEKVISPKSKSHPHYSENGVRSVKTSAYKSDQYIVKDLMDGTYKIVALKSLKEKGWERSDQEDQDALTEKYLKAWGWLDSEDVSQNVSRETYHKLRESVSRTKRIIWEYARCNQWDYFVTLTLDPEKIDRENLKGAVDKMSRMFWKINQSVTGEGNGWGRERKLEYVIVPEFHSDGKSIHFHGLMRGFHKSDIRINEHGYKEFRQWRDQFGFCNLQEIKDREKVCSYITKYVSKELINTVKEKGMHAFYASHGLNKPMEVYRGYGEWKGEFDYVQEDGYCKTAIVSADSFRCNFVAVGK